MSDIFISYKRGPDADLVEGLVQSLRANGFSVWWDRDIPARAPWEETIETELRKAHIVVVCWSPGAVASENVKSEARWAKERGKLLQAFVAPCDPPLFFGEHQGIQIFTAADLYGPSFEGLVAAAHAMLDAAAPPELAAAAEKLRNARQQAAKRRVPASWRKEEPAQPWEASQFGLTLSLLCTLILTGVFAWYLLAVAPTMGGPVEGVMWWLIVASGGVITPVAALFGGWAAYRMMAHFPRRVGFFTALMLSLVAGFIGGLLPLALSGVMALLPGRLPPPLKDMEMTMAGLLLALAAAAVIVGGLVTRLWVPFFLGLLRRALSAGPARGVITALALLAPVVLTGLAVWRGPGAALSYTAADFTANTGYADGEIPLQLRRTGRLKPADLPAGGGKMERSAAVDARVKAELNLAPDTADEAFVNALISLPAKTDWLLAADGSGDATTLTDIMRLSDGTVTVTVKPGVYRDPALTPGEAYGSAPPGSMAAAFETPMDYHVDTPPPAAAAAPLTGEQPVPAAYPDEFRRDIKLIGQGDRGSIVFEIAKTVRLSGSSHIEGVTIRPLDGKQLVNPSNPADFLTMVSMRGASSLINCVIVGGGGDGVEFTDYGKGSEYSRAAIRGNHITGNLQIGIATGREGFVDVLDNRIDQVGDRKFCIYINSLELIAVRNNDVSRCHPPGYQRIWSLQRSLARISDNPGANDTPTIKRDTDGVDDTAIY